MGNSNTITSEEFVKLINENRSKLYKTAMAILKNDDDACDAIQDALLSAYKNISSLKNKKYFLTWLTRILINKCYDIINKNKKVTYVDSDITDNTIGYVDSYNVESILENTLNRIDDSLREVAVLYYYDELSVEDISNILSIPKGTVKSRLSRARTQLYEIIKKEEGELDEGH